MPNKLARFVGYAKAPKATYMLRHPVKGAKALVAVKGARGLVTTRAGAVLGGMAAVPLAFFAMRGRGNRRE
jgi:hypothetical protein